jgi:hypothetical protein
VSKVRAAAFVALACLALAATPTARAGNGLSGTIGPAVTYVACDDFFAQTSAPVTRLNLGPGDAPAGKRSLGLVPSGGGTATGPVTWFGSLASVSSRVWVTAASGTSGAAHVWVMTADAPAGTAWLGSATMHVPAGGWQVVDARSLDYSWRLVDLASRTATSGSEPGRIDQFVARHGDGAGYVVTGFGCDGKPFNIDAVTTSAGSIDFEGLALRTEVGRAEGEAGTRLVTGRVVDVSGRLTGDPLQLQRFRPETGDWVDEGSLVLPDADGVTRAPVTPDTTTTYRWHRPQSQYADEGWSDTVTVEVRPAGQPSPAEVEPSETPSP